MNAPFLEREEERDLATRWRERGDEAALHRLTSAHMRLVIAMAAKFRRYGLPSADLIQEGNLGLEHAVDKFDWRIVFLVVGSVVLYGFILKLLGIYISVFVLVVVSSLASHEFSLKVAVANAIFLVVFSYLAFVKGLGLIFPLWPSFLGMN